MYHLYRLRFLEPDMCFMHAVGAKKLHSRLYASLHMHPRQGQWRVREWTWMRPVLSIFMSPKAVACFSSVGRAATVMSAPVVR